MNLFDVLKENIRIRFFVMLLNEIKDFFINYLTVCPFFKFNVSIKPLAPAIYVCS